MGRVFLYVFLWAASGCSVVSYLAVDDACKQSNIHCGASREDSREVVVAAAEKGFEIDKKIYQEIETKISSTAQGESNKEVSVICEGEEKKVCSSSVGCECI